MQSIFIVLLALGCISIVNTYQCYTCKSSINGGCEDPFNATAMTDKNKMEASGDGACMKITLTTKSGSITTRDFNEFPVLCLGGMNGCDERSGNLLDSNICCCTSDLCNGVSTVQQKPLTVFLTMSMLAMFAYQWY
ncbi:unnamed protein product [Adineta steineri]|uniref:Protein sleepless n=1 Tax=Adineta steineri TaxID=433720 RepID=A0A815M794_9BILA|nr:unnamed protein product [Adineta steineri]CAF3933982.1 unnamed protein product [Adineta steineri]CAF4116820.1 unnamed protein product [Adineta steineri]